MKIAGISSKKLGDGNEGSLRNEYGYNDKELWEDGDLNWLDYGFRNYDPQIGRFLQIDPLSDDYADLSPYLYAYNDPIANVDEDGLFASSALNAVGKAVSANTLPEVIVKSTIKKAASKSIGKIILTKIAENSVSLFGSLINSGNNFVDKGKEIYNRVSLNITLEDARTGTTFGVRILDEARRFENVFTGFGALRVKGALSIAEAASDVSLASLRRSAVRKAWQQERQLVERRGRGTRNWTKKEIDELKKNGKVKGYEGHHINNVADNPQSMAGDPNNIKFVKGRKQHLQEHNGSFNNPTNGELIDRLKMIDDYPKVIKN